MENDDPVYTELDGNESSHCHYSERTRERAIEWRFRIIPVGLAVAYPRYLITGARSKKGLMKIVSTS